MKKKLIWIALTTLVGVAMVLMSCNSTGTTTTEEEKTTVVTSVSTNPIPEVTKPKDTTREEKPRYGGIAILSLASDIAAFDDLVTLQAYTPSLHLTNEELLQGDWTKGPAGTGEANFILGGINHMKLKTGSLADSWQIPEKGKIIFHIRDGVFWHNKPPTNGRELSVDDIEYSIMRTCTTPGSYMMKSYPNLCKTVKITSDATTRTVTFECPLGEWATLLTMFPDNTMIYPKDAVEKFGDMNDWRNSIGTGAFIMTDFVSNGSVTLIKNSNFWETNPIGPGKGDKLPYLDGIKLLIIRDASTRMAAFRTGKIDGVGAEYDDVKEFLQNPDINSMMYTSDTAYVMYMRTDKPESPFSKKEVRQALYYATDFNKIKDEFYDGRAVILNWPIAYAKESAGAYVPMEKLPANVQDLFKYNPTKAKEMLTAAGYPTLNVNVICYNTPTQVDYLSVIKEMWSKVGINITMDAKEYAIWMGRMVSKNYNANELLYVPNAGVWNRFINFNGTSQYNGSYVNDPVVVEAYNKIIEYFGIDEDKVAQINAELMPYAIEQCWALPKPTPYSYVVWWPWVKNWNGELQVGYYNYPSYLKYRWQDVELKQKMTNK